jgi:hypothetical protein
MNEIAFAGKISESDFLVINRLATRRLNRISLIGYCAVILLILPSTLRQLENDFWPNILLLFFMIIVLPASILFMYRLAVKRAYNKNKVIQLPASGTVSDEGIRWNTDSIGAGSYSWDLFLGYRAMDALVIAYLGSNQVLYFPRRYFSSDEEWDSFREIISRNLRRQ